MTEENKEIQTANSLEQREAEARIAKLEIEKRVLSLQLSRKYERRELLKTLAGLGGLLVAFAAIGTFIVSAVRWQQESFETRQVKIEERLDRAFEGLGRDSSGSRLGGVASLKSFLTEENKERHPRVLLSLSHALAIEKDPIVRDAIVEVFSSINIQVVDKNILNDTLESLVGLNRAFYREGKLNRVRVPSGTNVKADSLEAQAQSNAAAIVALLKKGARIKDLSGIYCVRCDLSKLDLNSTIFDDAILELANFENSILFDSSFNRADLENANFRHADLRRANLGISGLPWYQQQDYLLSGDMTLYSWDRLDKQRRILFPSFECANLQGADFSGRALGYIITDDFVRATDFTNFNRSNLEKTKFEDFEFLILSPDKIKDFYYTATQAFKDGNKTYWIYKIHIGPDTEFEGSEGDHVLEIFRNSLARSNWRQSLLAEGLLNSLKKNPPLDDSFMMPCSSANK